MMVAVMAAAAAQAATNPFDSNDAPAPQGTIDKLVLDRLAQRKIAPAKICTDSVFLRRAFLDVIGTLPTEAEANDFIQSPDPNKRVALIDRLLGREEFADYWAMKWSDLLRIKAEFPVNLWPNAAQAYHRWIRDSIRQGKPYDRFVRELLTSSGGNFRVPPVNFYRAMQNRTPEGIAQTVALNFMGMRAENWPKERRAAMASFFALVGYKPTAEWKEEIVFFNVAKASTQPGGPAWRSATFPDGTAVKADANSDPREVFADWLIEPNNPYFARNIVNRVWSWLLGRGIIHEPDDIRPDNPPSNPELLDYLQRELIASHYDLKHVYRLILTSQAYQLSSLAEANDPQGAANFCRYPLRRLEAEVLIDALCQITGTTETYFSPIPEPFTYIPPAMRSIALPDGSIGSSFLELFGRPSRDTGLEAERNNRPSGGQRLHLLNSTHIQNKIEKGPKLQALFAAKRNPTELATSLYLTILSRYPTDEELKTVEAYAKTNKVGEREAAIDLTWALINSVEFLYRH